MVTCNIYTPTYVAPNGSRTTDQCVRPLRLQRINDRLLPVFFFLDSAVTAGGALVRVSVFFLGVGDLVFCLRANESGGDKDTFRLLVVFVATVVVGVVFDVVCGDGDEFTLVTILAGGCVANVGESGVAPTVSCESIFGN